MGRLISFNSYFSEIARKKLSSTRVTPHVTRSLSKRAATGKPTKGAICYILVFLLCTH